MKASEILQLINAGYTKADIEAMENPETGAPDPVPAAAPEAEPEPEPMPEPEEQKPAPEAPKTVNPEIEALTKQINSLVSAIQRSNILNSQQPQQPAESAEDILASIISPTHRAGNNSK